MALAVLVFFGSSGEGHSTLYSLLVRTTEEGALAFDSSPNLSNLQEASLNTVSGVSSGDGAIASPEPSSDATTVSESALLALTPPDEDYLEGFKPDQVVKYTVVSGDTIGAIADNFGVSVDTVVWANTLSDPNSLRLGQTLKIPPVTGIIHTVVTGDSVEAIAKRYKSDPKQILSFNKLKEGQDLSIGHELMVPGGEQPGPKPAIKVAARGAGGSGIYVPVGNGQCVPFVQAHGFPPPYYSGNAISWKRFKNTPIPVAGGVVVFGTGYGKYGHVAIITAVKSNSIQIVEQNYFRGRISHREIALNDSDIIGYITK